MRQFTCFVLLSLCSAIVFAFPKWVEVGIGSHDVRWSGGSGTLSVAGTFGGATVTFFYCAPLTGITQCFEVDATACTFTNPGTCDFFKGPGDLQLVVAGGTPSITAVAAGPTQASANTGDGGGTAIAIDADQDGIDNVFIASDVVTLDTDDDGEIDFEFSGSGGGIVAVIRIVGDSPLDRHLRFDFANSGAHMQLNAITQSGPGLLLLNSNALMSSLTNTATQPAFIPFATDSTTGIGRDTVSGGLSLIDNGTEGMRVLSTEVLILGGLTLGNPPSSTPPVACSGAVDGHSYWDTNQNLLCICDSITWAGVGGGVTCT